MTDVVIHVVLLSSDLLRARACVCAGHESHEEQRATEECSLWPSRLAGERAVAAHRTVLEVCVQGDHHEPLPRPEDAAQEPHKRSDSRILFCSQSGFLCPMSLKHADAVFISSDVCLHGICLLTCSLKPAPSLVINECGFTAARAD